MEKGIQGDATYWIRFQLERGRDIPPWDAAFWTGYVQGGFQGPVKRDYDPDGERDLGVPPPDTGTSIYGTTAGRTSTYGSIVFAEALRDIARSDTVDVNVCSAEIFAHELGHQFGLEENGDPDPAGKCLMRNACDRGASARRHFYSAPELAAMRGKVTP